MSLFTECVCGRRFLAPLEYAGVRMPCPHCGRTVEVAAAKTAVEQDVAAQAESLELDPEIRLEPEVVLERPTVAAEALRNAGSGTAGLRPLLAKGSPWTRMAEALLDPRAIHAILAVGGGLSVLGSIIWLASLGVFDNKFVLAVALGTGTLSLLVAGCYVSLRTKYTLAGRALTFLATVITPLNLWFYHAQGLVTVDHGLWVCGVVCCLLFAATVYALREPLFLYAVEIGVTLTIVLFLGQLHLAGDVSCLIFSLISLGVASILAERAFPPSEPIFSQQRFGKPLFHSGHAQLAIALAAMLVVQMLSWNQWPAANLEGVRWIAAHVTHGAALRLGMLSTSLGLGGGLWLIGAALYYYSARRSPRMAPLAYVAAGCVCGALWQFLLLAGTLDIYQAPVFAGVGVAGLLIGRLLRAGGERMMEGGRAVLLVALLSAAMQGLTRFLSLGATPTDWLDMWSLAPSIVAGCVGACIAGSAGWRRTYVVLSTVVGTVFLVTLGNLSQISPMQKLEVATTGVGLATLIAGYFGRFGEEDSKPDDLVTLGLWLGSVLATAPLAIAVLHFRVYGGGLSLVDELALVTVASLMLLSGLAWQVKSTTFHGGAALVFYLGLVAVSLGWRQQWAIGVYLAIGGAAVFAIGLGLSVYREQLLRIPGRMASREGVFQVLKWR